jgi:hypothetical protein
MIITQATARSVPCPVGGAGDSPAGDAVFPDTSKTAHGTIRQMRSIVTCVFVVCVASACDRTPSNAPAVKQLLTGDARQILYDADSLIVYSLNPDDLAAGEPRFHDYVVRSSRTVDNADVRRRIASAVIAGVAEEGDRAACFDPRHGVKATRGGASVDLLICFECSQVRAYRSDAQTSAATSNAAKGLLDEALAIPASQAARPGGAGG